jgi:membrane associated rhomboid family serine protease
VSVRQRFQYLRITPGAMAILACEVGLSMVYLLINDGARADLEAYVVASPAQLFERYRVWTLVTTPFLQPNFLNLLFDGFMIWGIVPVLERFWGTPRLYRFFAITSLIGVIVGCLVGLAIGHNHVPMVGPDPFIYGCCVAFGIVYARQPVQLFAVLPLTGRQFMYGIIGFVTLVVVLQGWWELGAGYAASMLTAAIMTSKNWSPGLAFKRWQIRRARAKLSVIEGGSKLPRAKAKKRDENKWLN